MQKKSFGWRSRSRIFNAKNSAMINWLNNKSSMTKRLEFVTKKPVLVKIKRQVMRLPSRDEAAILNMRPRQRALIREVLIKTADKNLLVGRSIFPKKFLCGKNKKLIFFLKKRALGALLFNDPSFKRGDFQITLKTFKTDYFPSDAEVADKNNLPLQWARRAEIFIKEKPFLLTEIVAPELAEILENTLK